MAVPTVPLLIINRSLGTGADLVADHFNLIPVAARDYSREPG
jgi:hypothetical protein